MFIANLKYIKPIEEVESNLEEHRKFLDKYYKSGNIILSGRKTPRTGGMFFVLAHDKAFVEDMIKEDPFYKNKVAQYEIIEFTPTNSNEDLKFLMDK